jgi:hypothetical protein
MKLLALVICLGLSQLAAAVPVGNGPGDSFRTSHQFIGDGWEIGSTLDPIEISYDPGAGPWIKTLEGQTALVPESTVFAIHENLIVGPDRPWFDWHEELLTPGWEWQFGTILNGGPTGGTIPGLTVSFDPAANPDTIWFDFDPLLPGTPIEIWKEIHCISPNGCEGPIVVAEFPTVPIPPAVWLFGSGLLGMVGVARRS